MLSHCTAVALYRDCMGSVQLLRVTNVNSSGMRVGEGDQKRIVSAIPNFQVNMIVKACELLRFLIMMICVIKLTNMLCVSITGNMIL